MSAPAVLLGIDTGGTFTDAVVAAEDGAVWSIKVPTTPHDLTVGLGDAVRESAAVLGLARSDLLRQTAVLRFSSTIATNTILTRSGPKLGLLVTEGHAADLYGATEAFAFVPPDLVRGIPEAVSAGGDVEREPDDGPVSAAVRDLLDRGARILVVSLRHAAANPGNERRIAALVDASYPRHYLGAVPVLVSTQVSVVADDAQRTVAAVANAYLHRGLARLLYQAEDDLRGAGLPRPLLVVGSDGGVTRVAKTRALATYQSGPAAGVHAAAAVCAQVGTPAAVTADVGGTSTDLGVVLDGRPVRAGRVAVGPVEVIQPAVRLVSEAVGGGSICRVRDGAVVVGPQSAGGAPGPACFGLGGADPTPTDAWLVLGFLDPEFFLGGRRRLDPALAVQAIAEHIGRPLGVGVEAAAAAVQRAAVTAVAAGIRSVLGAGRSELDATPAGLDTARSAGRRDAPLALVGYGGGGGILLPGLAGELGIGRVVLSPLSPVLSAYGVNTLDVRHREQARWSTDRPQDLEPVVDRLLRRVLQDLRAEELSLAAADAELQVTADDGSERAALGVGDLGPAGELLGSARGRRALVTRWREELAGRSGVPGERQVVVSVTVRCPVDRPRPRERPAADPGTVPVATRGRSVWLGGGWEEVAVHDWAALRAGDALDGPVILETGGTTVVLPDGMRCEIDSYGNAIVAPRAGG